MQAGAERRPIAGQHAVEDIGVGDVVETDAGADDAADGEETEAKAEDVDEHDPGPEDGGADADREPRPSCRSRAAWSDASPQ